MHKLGLVALGLSVTLGACADDDSKATTATASSTGADDAPGTTMPPPTTGSGDGASTGAPPATSTASGGSGGTSTGSATTGSEVMFCNGWQEDATEPFLELYDDSHTLMESGGTLAISCGGQGSWMFPIYPEMGGWRPIGGSISFAIEVVVEGFPGPFGAFFSADPYPYDIECSSGGDTFDGGFLHACIAVFPPDDYLADLSVLDGAPATIHVDVLDESGTPISTVDLTDLTVSAPVRLVSGDCFF